MLIGRAPHGNANEANLPQSLPTMNLARPVRPNLRAPQVRFPRFSLHVERSILFWALLFCFSFLCQSQNLSQGALGQVQAANRQLETLSKESEAALRKLCEGVQKFNTISQILTSLDKVNEM